MSTVETSVKVIPLGGLEQIGMNMTVFEYGESIIVVDCGMSFPGDEMLGIDMVIPDITYLKQNIHKVKGVFITHGHEDHIGALPFFFKEINVPLYGTKLTLGIIEGKLEEHGITKSVKRKVPPRLRVVSVVEDRLQGGAELSEIVNVALFKVGLHRMDHDPGEGEESNDGGEANKEGQPGGQGKGALSGHPAPQAYSRRRARSGSASARSRYQFWRAAASPPRRWR